MNNGIKEVIERLKFAVFEFSLIPRAPVSFPVFKGNTFRGALGKSFRELVCITKQKDSSCKTCLIREKCPYSLIFENYRNDDASILGKVERAPHPFVIHAPDKLILDYPTGSMISFSLTLIGSAIQYLPYFILAVEDIGKNGIGTPRTPFHILSITSSGHSVYDTCQKVINKEFPLIEGNHFTHYSHKTLLPSFSEKSSQTSLRIHFLSPLRLKFERKITKRLTFEIILRNILRRMQLLSAFYCDGPIRVDFKELIALSAAIKISYSRLHWEQQERFSHRQEKTVSLGGVSGYITLSGNIEPFLPFLKLAEFLHIGKGTAYGLGKIKLQKRIS